MKYNTTKEIIARIDRYLADARLEPEAQLRKRWAWIWMVVTCIFVIFTSLFELLILQVWPIWWFGIVFLLGYSVGFPVYRRVKRFDIVLNIIFSIFTVAALFAMLQVGGLTTSMGFIFIGMNCAMGSVLAGSLRWSIGMFILYCTTIVIVGIFQSSLTTPDYITPHVNTMSFVALALWINACILFIVILFMKDKSKHEKAEAERLRKIDEAKTTLFTNVSHEFRTPLTIIQGTTELIEQDAEKWLKNGTQKIKMQSQILLRLANQMLDISKIEAEGMQINFIHGDIKKFTNHIVGSFFSLAENEGINLHVIGNRKPIFTDYDPEILMHILANLISNAIKFTPAGGRITTEILSSEEKKQELVKIIVRDTGRGIPPEAIGHIFERFYQVPDKLDQTPGTGLGLALSLEFAKLMDGNIRVKSELGSGSEFIVVLPVKKKSEIIEDHGISNVNQEKIHSIIPEKELSASKEKHALMSIEKPILLIVEDNKDVVEYLIAILEKQYTIELASNGQAGLDKAQNIIPDIILSDVMMPQMDGFEMLQCLKDDIRTDHIPVVLLTARGDFQSKISGLEIGADHYLVKPFKEKELQLKLSNLLEARSKMQKHLGKLYSTPYHEKTHYKHELQFISQIDSLIDKHLHNETFGIKDICFALNMSRAQLYRKFTAITDSSIGRYLRSYRLQKARELITEKGRNVTEAALESGFKNLSHFSTIFREEFGISPKELL